MPEYESHSCSVSNEADALMKAFSGDGPTVGKSVFVYNYYGTKMLTDEPGLYNEVNISERIVDPEK